MQCTTPSQRARLLACRPAAAAVLSAATLLGMAAPSATAQSNGWEHYEVAAPKTITLEFETDLLAFDLCWSAHTEMTKEQIANGVIAQMSNPAQLHVIDLPGLPPFYRRTSSASVWRDLNGTVITASDILPNRRDYHLDVEQALIDIAGRIREARPGAKLTFKGFELQPLPGGRPPAYEELGAVQDFYITDRTIYLNHVGHLLNHALNSTFFTARVNFASEQENWLVFPNQTGQFSLASLNNPDWPPSEFEPEILALWGGGDEPEGEQEIVNPGDFAQLVPGSGFQFPTPEPDPIGSPAAMGYDAKAIARWNVVPYQTVTDDFLIGVVAFHMNGIDRVEFSLDGGPWVPVYEMQHNPRTDTWEYTINFPAGALENGVREVRAIVYPEIGVPRVLDGEIDGSVAYRNGNHSMFIYADPEGDALTPVAYCAPWGSDETGDGTEANPFRQPMIAAQRIAQVNGTVDGAEIYLLPGDYSFGPKPWPRPSNSYRWMTVSPAPGVSRDEVRFTEHGSGGFGNDVKLVRLSNVSILGQRRLAQGQEDLLWIDNCFIDGEDRTIDFKLISLAWWGGVYVTDTTATRSRNAIRDINFTRNAYVHDVSGSPFGGSSFVIGSRAENYNNEGTIFHGDVFHWLADDQMENVIVYNVVATDFDNQGIFSEVMPSGTTLNNVAIVNLHSSKDASSAAGSWWETNTDHLLLWNVSLPDQPMRWAMTDYGTVVRNLSIRGSVFLTFTKDDPAGFDASVVRDNHFVNVTTFGAFASGENYSLGNPRYEDPASGDYRPRQDSPLVSRLADPLVPIDAASVRRQGISSLGPFEPREN